MAATNNKSLAEALAAIDAAFGVTRLTPAQKPLTREEVAVIRADLDARQRAGRTVMLRNNKGRFIGSVKVATFGGNAPAEAVELPAFKIAAE